MSEPLKVSELLDLGERVLSDSTHIFEDHDNRAEAEELMALVLDLELDEGEELDLDSEPDESDRLWYLSLIARRAGGEPLPFLLGYIDFWGLRLEVSPGAFVPRPSSELTVERAIEKMKGIDSPVLIDVCTGAGPIAIAIADDVPKARVWGVDINQEGIQQGRKNAEALEISNVTLEVGDLFGSLPDELKSAADVITGHIPYVAPGEIEDLPSEVRDYEPLYTLSDSSGDGLDLVRRAVRESVGWIKPGGWLLLETAEDLAPQFEAMCREAGYTDISSSTDDDALSHIVEARWPA